jgi:hypothetical protein
MSVAERNITNFAENAKGAASRASVPPLSNAALSIEKENQRMTDNQIISNTKLEIIKASDIIISFIPAHLSWNDLEES